MELSQVVIQGDDPVSWTSSWGWVNCSLETCGKRWNHGFPSHFLSLSISILTILLLKILQGSAERPEHGRSTAYAECTKCAGDAQRCSSWIEWHGVAQLRTECPERRVTDGRKDGWIWMVGWNFYQKHIDTCHFILDFPEFSPQPFGQTWKFSFESENLSWDRQAGKLLHHCDTDVLLEFSGGIFQSSKETQEIDGDWCITVITRWWQLKYFFMFTPTWGDDPI